MSTSLKKQILGSLTNQQGAALEQIASGITIEFTTLLNGPSPGGWIGVAPVRPTDATFELLTTYDLPSNAEIAFRLLNGNQVVQSGAVTIDAFVAMVPLTQDVISQLQQSDISGYTLIKGKVALGEAMIAAVPILPTQTLVSVNKEKFRGVDKLGESIIDQYGNYEVKVPSRLLKVPGAPCDAAGPKIYLAISTRIVHGNGTIEWVTITRSPLQDIDDCCTTVDLHVDDADYFNLFYTELDNLSAVVYAKANIAPNQLHTINTNGGESELGGLAATTQLDEAKVSKLVLAAKVAQELNVSLAQSYVLICFGCGSIYDVTGLSEAEIDQALANAESRHQAKDIEGVSDIVEATLVTRADIAGRELTENGDAIVDIFTALLGSAGDAKKFLRKSTEVPDRTPGAIWDETVGEIGDEQTVKLQKGMQLLALTGMQPELSVVLLRDGGDQAVDTLATKDDAFWRSKIATARGEHPDRPCIPQAILDEYSGTDAVNEYARKLRTASRNLFATSALHYELGNNTHFRDSVPGASLIRDYLTNYNQPGVLPYDFRINNVWDITDNDAARNAMMPLQNLTRLTLGDPDAVIALSIAEMRSSSDIAEISEDEFISRFAGKFQGGADSAVATYRRAAHTAKLNTEARTLMNASNYLTSVFPMTTLPEALPEFAPLAAPAPVVTPDVRTLFGNLELCNCSDCTSMYSPGAYFTDIMNFVRTKLGNPPKAFTELTRRRSDLEYIDLTCKNANTTLPYVDLVNEMLESIVLKWKNKPVPLSFQTSGTAKELEAYPEHTFKDPTTKTYMPFEGYKYVYDVTLRESIYPNNLPFDLPVEESRTYLKHLGASRYDLMRQFRPKDYDDTNNIGTGSINEYNALAEWLKITRLDANIITDTTPNAAATPINPTNKYFNYSVPADPWENYLSNGTSGEGLGTLLHRSKISYKEMLQMLTCDFINQPEEEMLINIGNGQTELQRHRHFVVKAIDDSTTCDITKLMIHYKKAEDLDETQPVSVVNAKRALWNKWHRFLRLKRATGWSFYQLDVVLKSFGADGKFNQDGFIVHDIDKSIFRLVAKTHQLSQLLQVAPEKICSLWGGLSNTRYINFDSDNQNKFPSVYDDLFRNKAVLNPPSLAFLEGGPDNGVTYGSQKAAVIAALGVTEEELMAILALGYGTDGTALTLANLGPVFGFALLCKGLKIPVQDATRLWELLDTPLVGTPSQIFGVIEKWLEQITRLKKTAFSLDELSYLVAHQDQQEQFVSANNVIATFYTQMRSDLQLLGLTPFEIGADDEEVRRSQLRAVIYQRFAEAFGLDREVAVTLVDTMTLYNNPSLTVTLALQDFEFIASTTPIVPGTVAGPFDFVRLYEVYRRMHKAALVINRLRLQAIEVSALLGRSTQLQVTPLDRMVFAQPATSQEIAVGLNLFTRLNEWVMVRDRLHIRKDGFAGLLGISAGGADEIVWRDIVVQLTQWEGADLQFIINLLQANYDASVPDNNDFRNASLLLQVADIQASCKLIGLNPQLVAETLNALVVMEESRNVRLAAKARYNDEEWAKVAKPLQDVLRERQRQSLVSLITGTPGIIIVNGTYAYRDEKELYEYLLIDVEMKPCMKTSRIKQAISSVQLFMNRIILSLEKDQVTNTLIAIPADKVNQWETWRKWYRVWEANRKIFLYPENWIEPELRDDKTPFFKDMETQLLQDEVKAETAEQSFRDYLEMVDEVARLEPVGSYQQVDSGSATQEPLDVLHVFARTQAMPHRYYYRKLKDNEWSPWEKMNVDIKSNHIVPFVWNRRLYVFWLTFKTKKPANNTGTAMADNWTNKVISSGIVKDTDNDRTGVIEATLNWSEFKDKKWQPTQSCKDAVEIDLDRVRVGVTANGSYTQQAVNDFTVQFAGNGEIKLDELFLNRIQFNAGHAAYNTNKELLLMIHFAYGLDEVAVGLRGFFWKDSSKEPEVLRDPNDDGGYTIVAPQGSRFYKNKLVQYKNQKLNVSTGWGTGFGYFIYLKNLLGGSTQGGNGGPLLARGASDPVLNAIPYGPYRIARKTNSYTTNDVVFKERNPIENHFFFEDDKHTFFVSKEGPTYAIQQQNLKQVLYASNTSFSVSKEIASLIYATSNTQSNYAQAGPLLTSYGNSSKYRFHTFYHTRIHEYISALNRSGVPGLLTLSNQRQDDGMFFATNYLPNGNWVSSNHPRGNVQFAFSDPYSIYNWELFFHAPMLIAQRLSDNQQFDEARKWYHYIFNPTSNRDDLLDQPTGTTRRFWKFYPFYQQAQQQITTLEDLLQAIHNNSAAEIAQVNKWEKNPFKPHVIARMRILAYMKNVLMKYLDNLIAWGDQLFRRDTMESINEATQLYILAAHLLGRRPQDVPARGDAGAKTFQDLAGAGLDALSNAMVTVESYFAPNDGPLPNAAVKDGRPGQMMFYFCLPKNDKLLAYWDTIADRLFKIRNCMNLEGTVRELALYEPPIDPALLVRAAAQGISIGTVLNSLSGANNSHYRFSYVLQKANEFCNDVKSLGSSLLSALEKKDAEQLALLRSGQEMQLLDKVKTVKEAQVQEAEANLVAVRKTKENTQMRQQYYASRVFMNGGETQHLQSLQTGMVLQSVQSGLAAASSFVSIIPQFHGQAFSAIGPSFGGQQLAAALNAVSSGIGIAAAINGGKGSMALTRAGYERRMDDWQFQTSTAAKELEQLDQQILASEIRLDIARRELSNHEQQIENTAETDAYMRNKFSNTELYSWMSSQIAATYFQSYQLAFDLAKKAEACFDLELPGFKKPAAGYIGFAYWDSLRKGLQSGEKLQFDLRKMESAYMDGNQRELELSKNISLAMTDPQQLLNLRTHGLCDIDLKEELFDMDYPGHYLRRIKSVSISLPCIAGPYTTIPATLTLLSSEVRKAPEPGDLTTDSSVAVSIATSAAQNDSGVFELNFRDERYLPFENRGAVSGWRLQLNDEAKGQVRVFDFDTISDVILHVKYTARDGGSGTFRQERIDAVNDLLEGVTMPRYFSVKHEFSDEWFAGFQSNEPVGGQPVGVKITLPLQHSVFPSYAKGRTINIDNVDFHLKTTKAIPGSTVYKLVGTPGPIASSTVDSEDIDVNLTVSAGSTSPTPWSFTLYKEVSGVPTPIAQQDLSDLFLVMSYGLSS